MSNLFRMTIDIPVEDHKRLKALAAVLGKSMREIISPDFDTFSHKSFI